MLSLANLSLAQTEEKRDKPWAKGRVKGGNIAAFFREKGILNQLDSLFFLILFNKLAVSRNELFKIA